MLSERGRKLDHVLVLDAPDEELVMRIAGRRTCQSCQATYHVVAKPPRVRGVCDRCGGTLIQRSDDSEEIIRNRLREYNAKTAPRARLLRAGEAGRCAASTPTATWTRSSAASTRLCC